MGPTATLVVGASGSGKSFGMLPEFVEYAASGETAVLVADRHGMLTKQILLHLEARGRTRRVLYDQLSNYTRVLAPRFIEASTDTNPLRRDAENNAKVSAFLDLLWQASGRDEQGDWDTMPSLSMYMELGARIFLHQPQPVPVQWFPYLFRPKHPFCKRMIDMTTDEEGKEEWTEILRLSRQNSDNLLESKIGAARRLTRRVFSIPAFNVRCAGTLDVRQALLDKKIILLDGSDDGTVPPQVATALFRIWNLCVFGAQQKHYTETGNPLPCILGWEEAAATNSVRELEINILREGRKFGSSPFILTQDLDFIDPLIRKAVKTNTPRHIWYNPGDTDLAREAAEDVAIAQLDPHRVHSERTIERQVHDGFMIQERVGITKSGDRTSKTTSEQLVAKYKPVTDVQTNYLALEDQIKLTARELLNMGPGWRMIRVRGKYVSREPEYRAMLPDPYPEQHFPGLAEVKIQNAIAKSQEADDFITPVPLDTSWASTTTSSEKSVTQKPSKSLPKRPGQQGTS